MAKGNWTYINDDMAFDLNSRWLFCRDGVKYSPQELALITNGWTPQIQPLPPQVHLLKKVFTGTIIAVGDASKIKFYKN